MIKIMGITLLCAAALLAQDTGERVTVPLHDPSRPPRIHVHLLLGSIIVRGADINNVEVEARGARDHDRHERRSPNPSTEGMHRLTSPSAGLDITEDDNVVNIKTAAWNRPADLVITVPRHASLDLKSVSNGSIHVENVDGEIDADDLNGRIVLQNVSGSVVAHSLNGEVVATLNRVDPSKPMSFSTLNGNIDVTLPANVKADVRMKTDNGDIYSDFDVNLVSGDRATRGSVDHDHGAYHIRFDRTLRGTINGGGPEYQFTSFNGQIYIRKQK